MSSNKHLAKIIANFISDLDDSEVSNPRTLARLLEEFLDNEQGFPFDKNDFRDLEDHIRDNDFGD